MILKRALDWHCALVTIGLGVVFSHGHEPSTSIPTPEVIFGVNIDHYVWGNIFVGVGLLRVMALIINGRSPRGAPSLRGAAALLGTVLWSHLCIAFVAMAVREGNVRAGLILFGAEMLSDVFSAIRAGIELGAVRHRRWRRLNDLLVK